MWTPQCVEVQLKSSHRLRTGRLHRITWQQYNLQCKSYTAMWFFEPPKSVRPRTMPWKLFQYNFFSAWDSSGFSKKNTFLRDHLSYQRLPIWRVFYENFSSKSSLVPSNSCPLDIIRWIAYFKLNFSMAMHSLPGECEPGKRKMRFFTHFKQCAVAEKFSMKTSI